MVEKVSKIKLRGGKFDRETFLEFFKDEKQRVSIVYGRNGSGKSTVAKGFRMFLQNNETDAEDDNKLSEPIEVNIYDTNGNDLSDDIKGKVVVFDEKYVNENIGLKNDGIETIVLIGKQKEIDNGEQLIEKTMKSLQDEIDEIDNTLEIERKNHKSITKELDENCKPWKRSKLEILENTGNNMSDSKMNDISRLDVTKNQNELLDEYNKKFGELNIVKKKSINLDNYDALEYITEQDQERFDKVFKKHIVESNETVKEIYELTNDNLGRIRESKKIFEDGHKCPYCFQDIDDKYREEMLIKINNILSEDVNKYTQELLHLKINRIEIEKYEKYRDIDNALTKDIILAVQFYNRETDRINSIIDHKVDEPFEILNIDISKINALVVKINELIKLMNKKVENIKSIHNNIKMFKDELIELNDQIAHFEIKDSYNKLTNVRKIIDSKEKEKVLANGKLAKYRDELDQLKIKKGDVKIAVSKLNAFLGYILFSKNRIALETKENNGMNQYVIKVNGKNVLPKDVSTGERNIIAICYFFLDAMYGENENELYKNEKLYVIDDPISSFDYENKIGIMSFLRMQYDQILQGNEHSRILVLSHDIVTIRDTHKCIKDIYNNKVDKIAKLFELQSDLLSSFYCYDNLYSKLLNDIYNYASDEEKYDGDHTIGNKMRRVLEAFSTFTYKKGIEELSTNVNIINVIDNSEFYKNSMYRLILHGESHLEEDAKNIGEVNDFFQYIDEDSKKITARQILCLMHMLSPLHIRFQLFEPDKDGNVDKAEERIEEKIETIKKWEEEYKLIGKSI